MGLFHRELLYSAMCCKPHGAKALVHLIGAKENTSISIQKLSIFKKSGLYLKLRGLNKCISSNDL